MKPDYFYAFPEPGLGYKWDSFGPDTIDKLIGCICSQMGADVVGSFIFVEAAETKRVNVKYEMVEN